MARQSQISSLTSSDKKAAIPALVTFFFMEAGLKVNSVRIDQARLDTFSSRYEIQSFTETLVSEVEKTYWDFALAQRRIEIFTESLRLAEQQMKETEERIQVGTLAQTEFAAVQAEVALRRENLINARSDLAKIRLKLLRLLNPPGPDLWNKKVVLLDHPAVPQITLDDIESHVEVALRLRPDLNQARLELQKGDLEVVKTKNGLLQKLDFFITLGKSGYADSFSDSVKDIDGDKSRPRLQPAGFRKKNFGQKPKSSRSANQPPYWWPKPSVILLPAAYLKLKPW